MDKAFQNMMGDVMGALRGLTVRPQPIPLDSIADEAARQADLNWYHDEFHSPVGRGPRTVLVGEVVDPPTLDITESVRADLAEFAEGSHVHEGELDARCKVSVSDMEVYIVDGSGVPIPEARIMAVWHKTEVETY